MKLDNKEVVAQHFVLAGYLIGLAKAKEVKANAIEKLFYEPHSNEPDVNFDELVRFYLDNSLPFKATDQFLNEFYSPREKHTNLLTGASHSSGFGMSGSTEISLAFVLLAAHSLNTTPELPSPIAGMSGNITKENIKTIREVFAESYLNHGLAQLEKWIQSCEELHEIEEAKEITEAEIDINKAKEHENKFWEGYSRAVPVLSACLKNGNYEIDNNVKNEWIYHLPKIALFKWKYPLYGAGGDGYGLSIGHEMEKNLLNAIIEGGKEKSEVKGDLAEAINEAVKWMEKEGCNNYDKGIVIVASERFPEVEMFGNKDFVPSWIEDVKSMGFDGYYRGCPIIRLRKDEEEEKAAEKKPKCQKVVAVDFRGWVGLRVRKEVVTDRKFGELKIRTWTDEEIKQAIDSGKLDAKDADKAKGNCPVNVTFFWESIKGKLPRTKTFKFGDLQVDKSTLVKVV